MDEFYKKIFAELDWLSEKQKTKIMKAEERQRRARAERLKTAFLLWDDADDLRYVLQSEGVSPELIDVSVRYRRELASLLKEREDKESQKLQHQQKKLQKAFQKQEVRKALQELGIDKSKLGLTQSFGFGAILR